MKQMGKKIIREEVCFVPARLYKKRYISYTYACDCHDESIEAKPIGSEMKQMGKKIIREEVCFVPARLYKKRYISYTYACDCHDESIEAKPIRNEADGKKDHS